MVYLLLPYSKVFHVRSVTQGDVIRAEAKDIPRIFQVNKLVSAFFLYLFTLILFFRFCTLVKESLVNPKTTSGTTASPPSSPPPATSWWTSRSPVRVRSKIDCYKIQSFSSFTFDFFQVCYSWKGTSSSRSHITCPPPATSALSPCGRPSDPHPR